MAKRTRRGLREYLLGWSSKTYSRTTNTLKTLAFQLPHPYLRECHGKIQQKQCFNGAGIGCGNTNPLKGVLYIPGQTESYTRIRSPSLGATGPDACAAQNQLLAERFHRLSQLLSTGLVETLSDNEARAFVYHGQLALRMPAAVQHGSAHE